MVEIARWVELKTEPNVAEFLQYRDITLTDQELMVRDEQKVFSWDGNYSWWRCCEDYWNNHKEFRILMSLVDKSGKIWDDWLQFCKNFYCG